jgi:hypothetical protein
VEIARVLRLASDADRLEDAAAGGVTVSELAEAARQAGLDPRRVELAAAVEETPGSPVARAALGAPDQRVYRASLPGARLPADPAELARAVEAALGRHGRLRRHGPGHLVWKEDHALGRTTLTLRQDEAGTEVSLESDRAGHYLGAWFGGVAGWGLLAALTPLGSLGAAATVAGFLVVPFLLARPFWTRADRARRRRLEAAMMAALEHLDRAAPLPPDPGEEEGG